MRNRSLFWPFFLIATGIVWLLIEMRTPSRRKPVGAHVHLAVLPDGGRYRPDPALALAGHHVCSSRA